MTEVQKPERFLKGEEPEIQRNLIIIAVLSSIALIGGMGYVLFIL